LRKEKRMILILFSGDELSERCKPFLAMILLLR
jgi:hypothetical protein